MRQHGQRNTHMTAITSGSQEAVSNPSFSRNARGWRAPIDRIAAVINFRIKKQPIRRIFARAQGSRVWSCAVDV
jgi:hypothetical protein